MVSPADIQARYVDLPELSETFADHLGMTTFDGQQLRIEFQVTRLDLPKPPNPPTGRRYPCCRLILAAPAVVALYNQLQQIVAILEQQGAVKRGTAGPQTQQ